jgi:hypothetical protein
VRGWTGRVLGFFKTPGEKNKRKKTLG